MVDLGSIELLYVEWLALRLVCIMEASPWVDHLLVAVAHPRQGEAQLSQIGYSKLGALTW